MPASFDTAIPTILDHEGGEKFTNLQDDRGGATRWGITAATLGGWRGLLGPATSTEVEQMSREEACAIYRARYWDACRCGEMNDQLVAAKVFDMAVNCGTSIAGKLLQRALNRCCRPTLVVDGAIGSKTLEAVNGCDSGELVVELVHTQTEHYLAIVRVNPSQEVFKRGWIRRARWPFDTDVVT